jgi:hypothetical protein
MSDRADFVRKAAAELCALNAAVLVGAGASSAADLPTWPELLATIKDTVPTAIQLAMNHYLEAGKYPEAAQTASMAIGERDTWNKYFEPFETVGKVTPAWNTIAALGIPKIVTTNWDNIGEDSTARVWQTAPKLYVGADEALIPGNLSTPHIIHIHGKAPKWSTLVFTKDSYDRSDKSEQYKEFWVDLLTKRPLLIIGFSGADPAFLAVREYVTKILKIGRQVRPFLILPKSRELDAFGPNAQSWVYDDAKGHAEVLAILKELRDALNAKRSDIGLDPNPFVRAGLPAIDFASRDDLIISLAGIDFRSHCSAESFVALTTVLHGLGAVDAIGVSGVRELVTSKMRVSKAEATEAIQNALEVGSSFGWLSYDKDTIRAAAATPHANKEDEERLIAHIHRSAQRRYAWNLTTRTERYIKDASLAFPEISGSRNAASILGLDDAPLPTAENLRKVLASKGLGAGDASVEQQICEAVIETFEHPPEGLQCTCSRIAFFSFVIQMASHGVGRRLLDQTKIESVYFDTQILLAAIAPGHAWHTRCLALVEKSARCCKHMFFLDGFCEELGMQFRTAQAVAERVSIDELIERSQLGDYSNGFLQAYGQWVFDGNEGDFESYCSRAGLASPIGAVLRRLGIAIVARQEPQGLDVEVYARAFEALNDGNRAALAQHEADQCLILVKSNPRYGVTQARFVTAHQKIRDVFTGQHRVMAAAMVTPVAFSQYLAALSVADIPAVSVRDMAFEAPGLHVAQALFGMLARRFEDDRDALKQLEKPEIAERIRDKIECISEDAASAKGYDARRRLVEVAFAEVVAEVEKQRANPPKRKQKRESARGAREVARQLVLKFESNLRTS